MKCDTCDRFVTYGHDCVFDECFLKAPISNARFTVDGEDAVMDFVAWVKGLWGYDKE